MHILIISPLRMGDAIWAMPAVQAYAERHPAHRLTVLATAPSWPLWNLHPIPSQVILGELAPGGIRRTEERVRLAGPFDRAFIMPSTFLAAWIALRASVPERYGLPGGVRDLLVSGIVEPALNPARSHQAYRYLDLMLPQAGIAQCPPPAIKPDPETHQSIQSRLERWPKPWITFIPGADGYPSKQWPAAHFVTLGRRLQQEHQATILLAGTGDDRGRCDRIAQDIGPGAQNLAGTLETTEWLSLLAHATVAVSNDNDALQMAAAMGTPVVALFGLTDPEVTGPLWTRSTVLQPRSVRTAPALPRHSAPAEAAMRSIQPGGVFDAVTNWL